jgi:hypothetical protein
VIEPAAATTKAMQFIGSAVMGQQKVEKVTADAMLNALEGPCKTTSVEGKAANVGEPSRKASIPTTAGRPDGMEGISRALRRDV